MANITVNFQLHLIWVNVMHLIILFVMEIFSHNKFIPREYKWKVWFTTNESFAEITRQNLPLFTHYTWLYTYKSLVLFTYSQFLLHTRENIIDKILKIIEWSLKAAAVLQTSLLYDKVQREDWVRWIKDEGWRTRRKFTRFVRVFYKFPPQHNILPAKCEDKMRKFLAYNSNAALQTYWVLQINWKLNESI